MTYVPLRIRTEYSFLDSLCRVEALVERARSLRLPALGIADVHSSFGFVPFDRAARRAGVQPILGVTVRLQPEASGRGAWGEERAQIVLLARDRGGYGNLLRLLSRTQLEAGDAEVAVAFEDLTRFAAGLVALDGGPAGPVAAALARGRTQAAERIAAHLRELFGADGFYMEVQRHGAPEEARIEPSIVRLARTLNVPVVATHDVRYLDDSDAEAYDVLCCMRSGRTLAEMQLQRHSGARHALKSDPEMRQLYRDLPEALANTCVVAEQCRVDLDLGTLRAPEFVPASGRSAGLELRYRCERGARARFGAAQYQALPVVVRDRLAHELAVIEARELASCFLIVQDVVRHAKEEGIPVGPGRGSAAGSLVCFVLGITDLDPLAHGLLFERFLSSRGGPPPDFDLDIGHGRRDELVAACERRFGSDRVVRLASLTTLTARAAVHEVGRVLGLDSKALDEAGWGSEPAPGAPPATDGWPRLRQATRDDARIHDVLDVARRLEGLPRNPTLHAGGLLFAPGSVSDHVALWRTAAGEIVAQATHADAESLGLLRLDLGSLRALTVLHDVVARLASQPGGGVDLDHLALDDAATFRALAQGDTATVFQLEGAGLQALLQQLEPACFTDVVMAMSLCRPGPLASGLTQRCVDRRAGREATTYAHPDLEPVLRETHGLLLYPEQVLQVAAAVADYDLEQADALREVLQRRQIGELARERARFLRGAVEHGLDLEVAESIFDGLLRFSNFGFNKAHATAYAFLAYASAYLRAHHPVEYAVAQLEHSGGQPQRLRRILADALAHGVAILDVDVNRSAAASTAEQGAVRLGLGHVERLAHRDLEHLVAVRLAGGPFRSLPDFCRRLPGLPRRSVEGLIKAGAFGGLGLSRAQAISKLEATLRASRKGRIAAAASTQLALGFEMDEEAAAAADARGPRSPAGLDRDELPASLHGDPLLRFANLWARGGVQGSEVLAEAAERTSVRVGGLLRRLRAASTRQGERMAFVELEDLHGGSTSSGGLQQPHAERRAGHLRLGRADTPAAVRRPGRPRPARRGPGRNQAHPGDGPGRLASER
jgi:DNA polymerase-3 subunit alpha